MGDVRKIPEGMKRVRISVTDTPPVNIQGCFQKDINGYATAIQKQLDEIVEWAENLKRVALTIIDPILIDDRWDYGKAIHGFAPMTDEDKSQLEMVRQKRAASNEKRRQAARDAEIALAKKIAAKHSLQLIPQSSSYS